MNITRPHLLNLFKGLRKISVSPRKVILSFMGTTILGGFLYPQTRAKFELHFKETEDNLRRISKCPTISKGLFYPTPYLGYGTLQAVYAGYSVYCDPNLNFTQEVLELPDGGKIGMYWGSFSNDQRRNDKKAVMIILPGLTASAREPYVKSIVAEALENGYETVVFHNRGNEVELSLPSDGYFDPIYDFKLAVDHVREKFPDHQIFAVGNSFGANTLVNYLGKYKDEHNITAAASIANPFDFVKASQGMLNTIFDKYLAESLQAWAEKNKHILSKAPAHFGIEFEKAMTVKSMADFDEYLTRRMFGYSKIMEYYEGISSVKVLKDINIPLLCMHARDDPFLHESSIPVQETFNNEKLTLLVTNNGGHVGWFQGIFQPKRWFPKPTIEFLNACHEELIQN